MKRFIFLLLACQPAFADWQGKVVGITDGDTLAVLDADRHAVKIRLVEIDAPEHNQAFGNRSKQSLSGLCYLKTATVEEHGKDRYGRTLAKVFCDGTESNAYQVQQGLAWAYLKYQKYPRYSQLEADAKTRKLGLWADQNPQPPWDFRKNR